MLSLPASVAKLAEKKDPGELQKHMLSSYFGMRRGMYLAAFLLPIVLPCALSLYASEWVGFETSISAYYHTPARDFFVVILLIVSALLYVYKGFTDAENIALNTASIFLAIVAVVPTAKIGEEAGAITWHGMAAILFFASIFIVCWFRSGDTLEHVEDKRERERYRKRYRTAAWSMVIFPVAAIAVHTAANWKEYIFFAETFAIWAFASYWFIKSQELNRKQNPPEAKALPPTPDMPPAQTTISPKADRAAV
jgi:hypothetical protein